MEKKYFAFPGMTGIAKIFPWFLPLLGGLAYSLSFIFQGTSPDKYTKSALLIIGLIFVPLTLFSWVVVLRTALTFTEDRIIFQGIQISGWNIYSLKAVEVNSLWLGVRTIKWEGEPNGRILIKTDNGDISFEVKNHPETNAEIMRELFVRAPHLKGNV